MIPPALPDVDTRVDAIPMAGGLDLVTPAMSIGNGALLDCQNYEPDLNGGYRRAGTYEVFDGHPRPSDATYFALAFTKTGTINPGDIVSIASVTGTYVQDLDGGGLLVNPSGIPAGDTQITVSAVPVGTTATNPQLDYGRLLQEEAQALSDCADYLRTQIAVVPGEGAVRGVFMLGSDVYALRDDASPATSATLYKSGASGWTAVSLFSELSFTASGSVALVDGETVTGGTSGATATVRRVVLQVGDWTTTPKGTGRLILSGITGTFQSAETLTGSTSGGTAVADSGSSAITLTGGGTLRTQLYSFGGYDQSGRIYGTDGVNRAWEFDGTVLVPLETGVSGVYPSHVTANRRYLFLAYGSSLLYSELDDPYRWSATVGAGELAVGNAITNLVTLPGQATGIFTRNTTLALVGAVASEWVLQTIAADVGATQYTVQTALKTYALDDRGVMSVEATQNYGNFEFASASRRIQPLINRLRSTVVDSCVVRSTGIYRIFCSDGRVLSMLPGDPPQFGLLKLEIAPACAWSGEDSTGVERIFVGAADGYVYELDVGSSQNGSAIEARFRTQYVSQKSPRVRKSYRLLALDVKPVRYMTLRISGDLSYGDPKSGSLPMTDISSMGAGGFWEVDDWDQFYWTGRDIDQPTVRLRGVGLNLSVSVYQRTKLDSGHVIQSGLVHYTQRRLRR